MGRFVIMSSYHHKSGSRKRKERKDREEQMLNAQKGQKSITAFFPEASEPHEGQLQAETVSVPDVLLENQVESSESTSASAWVSNH